MRALGTAALVVAIVLFAGASRATTLNFFEHATGPITVEAEGWLSLSCFINEGQDPTQAMTCGGDFISPDTRLDSGGFSLTESVCGVNDHTFSMFFHPHGNIMTAGIFLFPNPFVRSCSGQVNGPAELVLDGLLQQLGFLYRAGPTGPYGFPTNLSIGFRGLPEPTPLALVIPGLFALLRLRRADWSMAVAICSPR